MTNPNQAAPAVSLAASASDDAEASPPPRFAILSTPDWLDFAAELVGDLIDWTERGQKVDPSVAVDILEVCLSVMDEARRRLLELSDLQPPAPNRLRLDAQGNIVQ